MHTKAIILKRQPTKEYDQLVTCYTQELGKVTAIAKSSLKPTSIQGMHLDVLNVVDFALLNGRATPIITGAHSIETFQILKTSLPHMAAASFFLEVVDRVAYDHQKDEQLWNFLMQTLHEINGADDAALMHTFKEQQVEFLRVLGYGPSISHRATVTDMRIDEVFEYTFGTRFHSLQFLAQVV